MSKSFLGDIAQTGIANKGGLSSLMGQPTQPATPPKLQEGVLQKSKKVRVSYYVDIGVADQLRDFVVQQRTVNNRPYYSQSEAIEEALKLLFERVNK